MTATIRMCQRRHEVLPLSEEASAGQADGPRAREDHAHLTFITVYHSYSILLSVAVNTLPYLTRKLDFNVGMCH